MNAYYPFHKRVAIKTPGLHHLKKIYDSFPTEKSLFITRPSEIYKPKEFLNKSTVDSSSYTYKKNLILTLEQKVKFLIKKHENVNAKEEKAKDLIRKMNIERTSFKSVI